MLKSSEAEGNTGYMYNSQIAYVVQLIRLNATLLVRDLPWVTGSLSGTSKNFVGVSYNADKTEWYIV